MESHRRLDERGNKELYRLLNREVTGQKALSDTETDTIRHRDGRDWSDERDSEKLWKGHPDTLRHSSGQAHRQGACPGPVP